jgi:hypothetical protein
VGLPNQLSSGDPRDNLSIPGRKQVTGIPVEAEYDVRKALDKHSVRFLALQQGFFRALSLALSLDAFQTQGDRARDLPEKINLLLVEDILFRTADGKQKADVIIVRNRDCGGGLKPCFQSLIKKK